ncbi:MAG TPA: carbamoyltransferase C-terminal domain-containing protein [Burkholderiales bacterium]|nr:carbamoyltransferase C-terminal domain-containing protein [Burkholderiales bacterium]
MFILGINAYHGDASACLLADGQLVAAAEEERFRRVKHWAGFPSESIRYCVRQAGTRLPDVAHIAVNHDGRANVLRKVAYTLLHRPDARLVLERLKNRRKRASVRDQLSRTLGERCEARVHNIEHHLAHLGSAFLVSPFEEAVAVSVDGFGDFASAAWGIGRGASVAIENKVFFPHSLGIFYQSLTQYLGFPNYGDEYKLMGLAPYGEPRYIKEMRRIVRLLGGGAFKLDLRYFRHARERIEYDWDEGAPVVGNLFSDGLSDLLGPARKASEPLEQRHRDIARSAQVMYEEAFFHLLNSLHGRYKLDALCLAGGCAMNSVANGKVYERTPFRRLYVQSAAGDAGGAIGAAMIAHTRLADGKPGSRLLMDHAYWGPSFSNAEIASLLDCRADELRAQGCAVANVPDTDALCVSTARAIADGKVVGWFQGRMEWGPRALGNRSIVCDPRRADMKEILNTKIKRRESFRPFAPSILREEVAQWFETDDDVPFMMQVYRVRTKKRGLIPAVTHVDGSGRLQTVTKEANAIYYGLIKAFREITTVPLLLNTSFNENEPVVCTPSEALECFLRTRMDMLVMGSQVVTRPGG